MVCKSEKWRLMLGGLPVRQVQWQGVPVGHHVQTFTFTSPDETTGVLEIIIQAASVDTGSGMKKGKLKGKVLKKCSVKGA